MSDPELSLDIPPPASVPPPESRAPGALDPYIGTTFDHRYKIEALLGEGGMGFVYRARHKVIDKKVAIKVLRADLAKDREILDRFLQEAKAASSIGNSHIVDISDFGDLPDGSTYFVMEYLDGKNLSNLVESGQRIPVARICHLALQVCDGLAAAHARGIVHRDLKPDNVFVVQRSNDPDFVKVLDFGIAKVSGNANTRLTKAGAVFGTPHYMSPEQAAGAPIDHRTDIYSLGVMLYEMVSGQLPFNADNFMGILTQHMYKAPVPIRALVPVPECPPSLEAVILKCLTKKPEGRYQSMEELARDLESTRDGRVPTAVAEMMARSGGFNVPHDYFKQPAAMVPATPKGSHAGPRYVLGVSLAAALALVTGIIVYGATSSGKGPTPIDGPQTSPQTQPQPPGLPTQTNATPPNGSASPVKAAAKKGKVTLSWLPKTAVAIRDKNDKAPLQQLTNLDVDEAKPPVTVAISAKGFDTATIELSIKDGKRTVTVRVPDADPEVTALDDAVAGKEIELKPTPKVPKAFVPAGGSSALGKPPQQTTTIKPPHTGSGSNGGHPDGIVDPWATKP